MFHTSPQAPHRQYDEAFTTLLAVTTSREPHDGHFAGTSSGSMDSPACHEVMV
jgi:hypothetical protein